MASSPVREFLVTYLMPDKCYEEILVHFHLHVPCLSFILIRFAGFGVLLDTLLAQPLQLLKILWRGSAEGLSPASILLQLYAFSCPVVYAMANNFPLFAWAERLLTLVQTAALVFLTLRYRGESLAAGMLFLSAHSCVMLLLGSYAAAAVISLLQKSSLAAMIASKAFQAGANYGNGHTGQLSTLSVLLTWAGSVGATVISLQETGSSFATLSHTLSACLSCVLLAQVFCYKSSTTTKAKSE